MSTRWQLVQPILWSTTVVQAVVNTRATDGHSTLQGAHVAPPLTVAPKYPSTDTAPLTSGIVLLGSRHRSPCVLKMMNLPVLLLLNEHSTESYRRCIGLHNEGLRKVRKARSGGDISLDFRSLQARVISSVHSNFPLVKVPAWRQADMSVKPRTNLR